VCARARARGSTLAKVSLLDMKDMTPEEKRAYRRNLSIEELILTENEYLYDLQVLVRVTTLDHSMIDHVF